MAIASKLVGTEVCAINDTEIKRNDSREGTKKL